MARDDQRVESGGSSEDEPEGPPVTTDENGAPLENPSGG
jgi:hypothetical protein